MLDDLDTTLKKLLAREVSTLEEAQIHFDAPDNSFAPSLPALDLFLYDVRENWELRSNEWQVERSNSRAAKLPPPARVDCSYLITAWAGDIYDEHRLLGAVMQALLRHRTLPAEVLQGKLAEQEPPVRAKSLQASQMQSLGEFWQAMGGQPKATLNYAVTISVPVGEPVEAPLVTEKVLKFRLEKKTAP